MQETYALGPFLVDVRNKLLFHGSEPVRLGRRSIALLLALVERRGAVVSKDALIEAAWPNQVVEEANLSVQIAALRRALGETPGGDRWIETLPRRGYRFIGPAVAEVEKGIASGALKVDTAPDLTPTQYNDAARRQITAMSCELVGNARPLDSTDLEARREAGDAFRHCVSEVVGRYSGFIAGHLGSAVLIFFGYPAAREHDAEHAVRSGLELCAAIRTLRPCTQALTRCRVGIATGTVIIGDAIGVGERPDHEIVGDTPDLAMRLQILAQPDTVAIEHTTRHLIGDLFDCRGLDAIETAGDREPVRRWQVLGERVVESRFEALRGSGLSSLIGRDEEIDLLLRRWERAKTGDGQIVLVSGEAGIGKSGVVTVLAERLHAEAYLRLRYCCSPHHQDSALFPFVDQLGRAAGFARDDPPETKLEKLEAILAPAVLPGEDIAFLADLLSLPGSERHPLPNLSLQRKKERILEALIRQLQGFARRQPVMAVFEDAHWVDPTSLELVHLAVERVRTLPVLLIVTFRPEFQPPWTGLPQVTMLALNRLDRRDRTALATKIAGGKTLPDEIIDQIVDRTDGVPLFVEELTKSVLESGLLREEADRYVIDGALPPLAIPTTLHASLMARLDRLPLLRRVAQIGAAIGRDFSYELLRAASSMAEEQLQAALARLVASELVFQRGAPPEAVYSFKHALVQDAAHGSLLRGTRRRLHARIAEALETRFPETMEIQPELLAQHYAEAGLVEKSVIFWGKAGRRSADRSAMTEAAAQYQKGLDQLALLPETPERQQQELEFYIALGAVWQIVKGAGAPETGQAHAQALELWEQLGAPAEFLGVPFGLSRYYQFRGELDLANRLDEGLLRLSRQRDDSAGLILGHISAGRTLFFAGRFTPSRSHLDAVRSLYDPTSHRSFVLHQTGIHPYSPVLGVVLFCLGYPDQALAQCKAAVAEARNLAHLPSLASSLAWGTTLLSLVGDDAALDEQTRQLIAVATEQSLPLWHARGTIHRGWIMVKNGASAEGIPLLRSGLISYRASGQEADIPFQISLLARACEMVGQIAEAVTLFDDALKIVEKTGERWLEAELSRHKGQLLERRGHADAGEELYRKALNIAQEQEAKLWELRAAVSLARLWGEQGRRAQGRDLLASIYGWFTEGFGTPDLKEAKALLECL